MGNRKFVSKSTVLTFFLFFKASDKIGRKKSLITVAIPQILAWVMIAIATNPIYILASRLLSGVSGGALYVIIPLFTSEISDDKIRGRLGSVYVFSVAVGILFAYTCGTFFKYETLPFLYAPFSFLFLIGSIAYPDSAHFFVKVLKNSVSAVKRICWNLLIFCLSAGGGKFFEILSRRRGERNKRESNK